MPNVERMKTEMGMFVLSKSRMTYVLLGFFFGMFGAHNFYIGCWGRGVSQMLITILTLGVLLPGAQFWAIVEICLVRYDVHGVPLA